MTFDELPCRWRGAEVSLGRRRCRSSKLSVSLMGVDAATCAGCYCRDHAPARSTRKPRVNIGDLKR